MNKINQQLCVIIRFSSQMIPDIKKHVLIAFFAGLSVLFFSLVPSYMLKGVFTAVTSENSFLLNKYICFFILLLAGIFTYNCIFWNLYGSSTANITGEIRRIILSKLCSIRLSDVENRHSADIMSTLTNDLDTAQEIYVNFRFYTNTLTFSIIPTILVFNTSSVLGVIIILLSIIQLTINLLVIPLLEKQSIKIREDLYKINSTFSDILRNNMSIRLYYHQNFYVEVSKNISKSLYNSNMKLNIINSLTYGLNVCFGLLGYIIVLTTGSTLIGADKLNLPDLLFITQMRLMMVQGILAFGNYATQIQPAVVGIKKIMSFMDYIIEEDI